MWRNYLTVSLRSLARNKVYTFINLFGLAIGMAACLLILLYVRYELSYDRQLPDAERTYQLQTTFTDLEGKKSSGQMAAYVARTTLAKDFPQIDKIVYALSSRPVLIKDGEAFATEGLIYVDGPAFDVLQLPFASGNPASALASAGSVVLTETEAAKRFGARDPIGETITLVSRGKATDYRVTGILKDLPRNSHLKLSIVARFDPSTYFAEDPDFFTNWSWQSGWIYFSLKPGAEIADVRAGVPAWERRNIPPVTFEGRTFQPADYMDFSFVSLPDIHLGEIQDGAMKPGNDRATLTTFAVIAVLIVAMACVNFTNLATARASQRMREVALRKVVGATRRQLIVQFLGESIVLATVAMILGIAMVELAVPHVAAFLNADFGMQYVGEDGLVPQVVGLLLVVGILAGLYPAVYLSRFHPAAALKANRSAADAGSNRLRSALVVAQFAVSIGLIVCTAVVYAQADFARTLSAGYQREGLLQIDNVGRDEVQAVADALLREVRKAPGVVSAGRTAIGVATSNRTAFTAKLPGRASPFGFQAYAVDAGFLPTVGTRLLAGRGFDEQRATDSATPAGPSDAARAALVARGVGIVVNAKAVDFMGFGSPDEAIGKQVGLELFGPQFGFAPATIIGVAEDTRFRSIREPVEPTLYVNDPAGTRHLMVRYTGDPAKARAAVESVWRRLVPNVPFEAGFAVDIVRDLYEAEEARAQMFAAFAGLSIIVGCLGLFGLAAFTAERRTKEIGIRKVLGARTQDIVRLLVWQFSKPVVIANVIAWPVAWWAMRDWLNGFDTRIDLDPGFFIGAGLLAMVIASATIIGHALRVARANPIHALRYE